MEVKDMSTVVLPIYKALEQKKILEDRVDQIRSHRLCCVRKANADEDKNGTKLDDILEKSIRPAYQSSVALLKNLIALKAAINEANARIKITVDGKEYTIANAIVMYRSIDRLSDLYKRMLGNYQSVSQEVETMHSRLLSNEAINSYLEKVLGDGKRDPEIVKKLTDDYIARNTYAVYDPLGTEELARKEIEHLERFKNDMHYALVQANIENEITVEFED